MHMHIHLISDYNKIYYAIQLSTYQVDNGLVGLLAWLFGHWEDCEDVGYITYMYLTFSNRAANSAPQNGNDLLS